MSDEYRTEDEAEVEGHVNKASLNDEPAEDADDEVEGHVHKVSNLRLDSPSNL
jgi:hypothetical protein